MKLISQGDFIGIFEKMCSEGQISSTQQSLFEILKTTKSYKKGELIAQKDSLVQKFYVVKKGVIRSYINRVDGKDFTKSMARKGMITGPYEDFLVGQANSTWIEALTEVEVDEFSIEAFHNLMSESKGGRKLLRLIGELCLFQKEWREVSLLSKSALERYREFLENFAEEASLIAKNKIATYIGITPEGLSRLTK